MEKIYKIRRVGINSEKELIIPIKDTSLPDTPDTFLGVRPPPNDFPDYMFTSNGLFFDGVFHPNNS